MDPALLTAFVTVADVGTVSAAAVRLNVVQSGVSRRLQRLQHELKVPLFSRVGTRIELTRAGEAFLPVARSVLQAHRDAEQFARALAAGRLDEFGIAAPGTTLIDVVIPFVATLGAQDPRARVAETQLDDSLPAALARHDLVVMPMVPPRGVVSLPLVELPVWAYVAPGHAWAGRSEITLGELVAEPIVAPASTFMARRVLDGAVAAAGLAPPVLTEANSGRVAQALVATGAGVAVVTEDRAFDLLPLRVTTPGGGDPGLLTVWLHAAWRHDHFAAEELAGLAARLQAFVSRRYAGDGVVSHGVRRERTVLHDR